MTLKSPTAKKPAEQVIKDIRRVTRRHFSAEDKIRIVLEGLRGFSDHLYFHIKGEPLLHPLLHPFLNQRWHNFTSCIHSYPLNQMPQIVFIHLIGCRRYVSQNSFQKLNHQLITGQFPY